MVMYIHGLSLHLRGKIHLIRAHFIYGYVQVS